MELKGDKKATPKAWAKEIAELKESGHTAAQRAPKSTDEQTAPTMRKTIGSMTYIVTAHFSETSEETMSNKICRMIKRDIESGNY